MSVPLMPPGTMEGIVTNGTMAGVHLDGTKVGNKRMTLRVARKSGEWVLPAASTLQPEERFCGGFWSKHACGHEERP